MEMPLRVLLSLLKCSMLIKLEHSSGLIAMQVICFNLSFSDMDIKELDAVAKMGSFWNIPVISYMPTTTALSDRTIYKTLARISSKNTNSIAKAVVKLIEHYGWRRVSKMPTLLKLLSHPFSRLRS